MIEITIKDTENKDAKPMVLTGEHGFVVVKVREDKDGNPVIGAMSNGEIETVEGVKDLIAMGKATKELISNFIKYEHPMVKFLYTTAFLSGFERASDFLKEVDG